MTVVCYSKPSGSPDSGWQVAADGDPTWTHHTSRGATATISTDASGAVEVNVVAPVTVTAVEVTAEQPGVWPCPDIRATFSGREVGFQVPAGFHGNLLVRINNAQPPDWQKWCSLGVLPLEDDDGANATHRFGPGVHTGGPITLRSGESIYVAGGAYLNRRIMAGAFNGQPHQVTDVRVYGRGVVDTSSGYGPADKGLGTADLFGVDNLTIEGITYVSRYAWAIASYLCHRVRGDWIRLYSCEIPDAPDYGGQGTPDGWDFVGCTDVKLSRSFLSASDDSSAIKSDKYGAVGDTSGVVYEDLLLMQGGKSNGFDLGWEHGTRKIGNVTYRRVKIAECWRDTEPYRTAPLGIHVPSKGTVDGVLYEDIDIDRISGKDFALFVSAFYTSGVSYSQPGAENRGVIRNVTFRRVHWPATTKIGKIVGEGPALGPIVFEDCTYDGQPMTAPPTGWEIVNSDVTFKQSNTDPDPDPDPELEGRVEALEATVAGLITDNAALLDRVEALESADAALSGALHNAADVLTDPTA